MSKDKKHLEFDLDFLESVETKAPKKVDKQETDGPVTVSVTTNKSESTYSKPKSNSCLIAGIIIGVIALFIWIGSSDSSSPTTPSSSCDNSKLQSLKPSDSDKNTIDSLKRSIDSSYVNQYSQSSVDQYNVKVDQYNSLRNSYNSRVDNYNNYLNTYCKK
jgi:hypothetical protein